MVYSNEGICDLRMPPEVRLLKYKNNNQIHIIVFRVTFFFRKKTTLLRLDNFLVPVQGTGNSGCFPGGKRAAILRGYPAILLPLCAVISCFHPYTLTQLATLCPQPDRRSGLAVT